jgi:cell division transport system ATP-binding protein
MALNLMIQLHNVWKMYGAGSAKVSALADVSFQVAKGEFAVLAGPSGAGKTTLLRLLYRDELPTEGEIQVAGREVTGLSRRRIPDLRRAIGIVFQDARLLSGRTVYDNVAFVLRVLGTPLREITPRVFQSLKAVGLQAKAQAFPAQLSQGEQQRAALARALVKEPQLLLADEPTGNLDELLAEEILDLLKEIWSRGTTVLLATHRLSLASQLRRRTLILERGRLVKDEG